MAQGSQKVCTRGGGGASEPPEGGRLGLGKGAVVTGQSQDARLKPPMMTHHLRCEAVKKNFVFKKKIPPIIHTSN